jgi:hypothetical protein
MTVVYVLDYWFPDFGLGLVGCAPIPSASAAMTPYLRCRLKWKLLSLCCYRCAAIVVLLSISLVQCRANNSGSLLSQLQIRHHNRMVASSFDGFFV